MKQIIYLLTFTLAFASCTQSGTSTGTKVSTNQELKEALKKAEAGDVITMANGIYTDLEIKFTLQGTEDKPITLRAETAGEVFIEGVSCLKIAGEYLTVSGLHFRNGYTPSNAVIQFKKDKENLAYHCTVTECVIEDFNQPMRDNKDHWVEFWGRHNTLSNCYIAGKANQGPTIRVSIAGNQSINNYHQIVNNHFGPRPRKGGPRGETIQIGDSYTSMSPCYTNVTNNLFEKCNGEVEVISSKTNFNTFTNNVFYKSEGSLVMRHGNYCRVDGNYFIGDETNNIGGVRIINTGHWVVNNYFYSLRGNGFRTPLAIMNGIPKSPLNRYNQVTDVVVAHNTWVDCVSPWQFGIGSNIDQAAVLPKSEIRSARPKRVVVANNVIYNSTGDILPLIPHDSLDGINFVNNVINNQGVPSRRFDGILPIKSDLTSINDYIKVPTENNGDSVYSGFDFETIEKDIVGNSRSSKNQVGAFCGGTISDPNLLDYGKYGPSWFVRDLQSEEVAEHEVSTSDELIKAIAKAKDGDFIFLKDGMYNIAKSLAINKNLTIKGSKSSSLVYEGPAETPLFEMNPKGDLIITGVQMTGSGSNYAFATLKENMSSHYNLTVTDCSIGGFDYVLKAYKQSMSQYITFTNTKISDCSNGIELSEETNDKGDYNVEFLTLYNCDFRNVKANVVDYYRGGYDESTIGGNLSIKNSKFSNCGQQENNGILLNHRGIINVNIANNTFENNKVSLVARLWGAKNNLESNNELTNSGKIITEENIAQKLMY